MCPRNPKKLAQQASKIQNPTNWRNRSANLVNVGRQFGRGLGLSYLAGFKYSAVPRPPPPKNVMVPGYAQHGPNRQLSASTDPASIPPSLHPAELVESLHCQLREQPMCSPTMCMPRHLPQQQRAAAWYPASPKPESPAPTSIPSPTVRQSRLGASRTRLALDPAPGCADWTKPRAVGLGAGFLAEEGMGVSAKAAILTWLGDFSASCLAMAFVSWRARVFSFCS